MLEFEREGLKRAEETYRAIRMEPRQEKLVKEIGDAIAKEIGLDPIPCRGFLLMAIRQWQIAHETTVDVLAHQTPEERATSAREITDEFAAVLRDHLRDPEKRRHLDRAVEKGFAIYLKKYNRRPQV